MNIYDDRIVLIASNNHPEDIIFLLQLPSDLDDPEWRAEVEEKWSQRINEYIYTTQSVDVREVTVNNQPNTVRILEGVDENGTPIRQAVSIFPGKIGDVLLVIVGNVKSWDQAMVDKFIQSIH